MQLVDGCSGLAYSGVDVCVSGAVLPDVNSKVPCLRFDLGSEGFEILLALLWNGGVCEWVGVLEVYVAVGIHPDELTFAQVELEVVSCSLRKGRWLLQVWFAGFWKRVCRLWRVSRLACTSLGLRGYLFAMASVRRLSVMP